MCSGANFSDMVPIISSIIGGASSFYQSKQEMKSAKKSNRLMEEANQVNRESSEAALAQQQREINRRNTKVPNVAAILQNNRGATQNQTLLSGPLGVDNKSLELGRNTLLGR